MRRPVAVLLLAVLALSCGKVNAAQPRMLLLAFKAGATYKYRFDSSRTHTLTTTATSLTNTTEISADESITVKSVDSSGNADLALTITNYAIKTVAGGVTSTTTLPSLDTSDVQVASDGRVITWDGSNTGANDPLLAFTGGGFFTTAVLADHPVKPGDTWTKSYTQTLRDATGSGLHVVSNSTYLRNESLDGVDAAVVETKSTATIDVSMTGSDLGMTMKATDTADVTTWFDPSDHRVMKTHATSVDNGTMDFTSTDPTLGQLPGANGPMSDSGTSTTDLTPAQ